MESQYFETTTLLYSGFLICYEHSEAMWWGCIENFDFPFDFEAERPFGNTVYWLAMKWWHVAAALLRMPENRTVPENAAVSEISEAKAGNA